MWDNSFGRFSELRVGYETAFAEYKLRLGSRKFLPCPAAWQARLRTSWTTPMIRNSSRGFSAENKFPGGSTKAPVQKTVSFDGPEIGYFQPITKPASLFVESEGGTTFGRHQHGVPQFFLGGPVHLSAMAKTISGAISIIYFCGIHARLLTLPPFSREKKSNAVGAYEIGKCTAWPPQRVSHRCCCRFSRRNAVGPFFIGGSVGDSGIANGSSN